MSGLILSLKTTSFDDAIIAWRQLKAFVIRDAKIQLSYRLAFVLRVVSILFATASLFFLSRMIGRGANPYLEPYGGDYFSFVLVGMVMGGYLMTALHDLGMTIRDGQLTGTLEGVLLTPVSMPMLLGGALAWRFLMTTLNAVFYLLIGMLMGLHMTCPNLVALLAALVLAICSFLPFGILAASFVLVFKKGNPIAYALGMLSNLLCGVMFPVSVLPEWLQALSSWIPLTRALRALRLLLLQGALGRAVVGDLLFLFLFSVVALPLSGLVFRAALRFAMKQGTLSHY